jgi:SAM-dependent methyltransferase
VTPDVDELARLYRLRFPVEDRAARDRLWAVLCRDFFQGFVAEGATVLDLGCGYGEFIRHIRAGRKIAIDVNPDAGQGLPAEVAFHQTPADRLDAVPDASVDLCFTSNFFEHLPDKPAMSRVLAEVRRVLKPGGRLVALQPNIRYLAGEYWDFYDHLLPPSHLSCREAFEQAGLSVTMLVDRFLPYTTRSRLPQRPWLVRAYLRNRWAWRILGKQFLIVGEKR